MLTPVVLNRLQAEKDELNWLLTSGVLGRSSNLARMLTFVCEEHFQGQDDQVTEHSIATEALGRRDDFDPQNDTIVRVTAHSLRKRLQEIYQADGVDRPVHIQIPLGNYMPSFVHIGADGTPGVQDAPAPDSSELEQALPNDHLPSAMAQPKRLSRWLLAAAFFMALSLLCGFFVLVHRNAKKAALATPQGSPAALPQPTNTIRALMGTGRKTYVDHSGYTWAPGNYCSGGDNVTVPAQNIVGTEDSYLYLGGIRGIALCIFPVNPGEYEVHFHFAETSDLQTATHVAILSINAGTDINFDVVDNAGGDGIATSYVLTGIRPENDGAIHLDYSSQVSLLNAVEILPADSENLLPVRITTSPFSITDSANQLWLSERYFSGGRRGQVPDSAKTANRGIYSYHRVGRFRYDIPVTPLGMYRVTLYFSEPWFGEHNSVNGGPGSRIFNVSCNGNMILKNFDILAEGGTNPVVKTFDNIQASTRGKIELSFIPVVNYPEINAIEVIPEPSR
ncbi:MAG: malectin domain-containing carbohydrate-binding protein [Terracidiphilus sp.]